MPPWCFRPERERTPERGREKGLGAGCQAFLSKEVEQGTFNPSSMRLKSYKWVERKQLPLEVHAGPFVIDRVNVFVL